MTKAEEERRLDLCADLVCAIENAVRAARAAGLGPWVIGHHLHVQLKLIDPEFERHYAEWRRQFVCVTTPAPTTPAQTSSPVKGNV